MINLDDWASQPLSGEKEQDIKSAFSSTITEKNQDFITFIRDRSHPSGKGDSQDFESAFAKLFNDYRKGKLEDTVSKVLGEDNSELKTNLKETIQESAQNIAVSSNVLEKNINISAYRQDDMFHFIREKVDDRNYEELIPAHPLQEFQIVLENYRRIFKWIHSHFEKLKSADRSQYYFAPLAIKWMRGDSLANLINDAYDFKRQDKEKINISTVIRDVMRNIEQDLRFRYVKYINCYIDLLIEAFRQTSNDELIERIPPVPLFLEVGASSQTMISLVGLGLSRTTASIIASRATNSEMSISELQTWFRSSNFESLEWSNIVLRELRRVL